MNMKKERVDVLLVERGLFETREKAKRAIMAGLVYSNEERIDKPGEKIHSDAHTYGERKVYAVCKSRWIKA